MKGPWSRPIVIMAIGAIALVEALNFTGFCYRDLRYLSDQEFIDKMVLYNLARHGPSSERNKTYGSLREFYQVNPQCCELHRWGDQFSDPIIVRLVGFYRVVGHITYRSNDAAGVDNFYSAIVSANACGDITGAWGEPRPERPKK